MADNYGRDLRWSPAAEDTTRVSTELNRFVRKVTAWGTVGIAWTVIVGLYGMNFAYMPELGWRWGYPTVLAVMLIVGVLLVLLFRRRGWL